MNAYTELMGELEAGETVEAVVFGDWGWDGYNEPEPALIPLEKRGVVLTAGEAKPIMSGWSIFGGFGAPDCYAMYVWTNRRVLWITQYDGATFLSSAPRNPSAVMPEMPGS